jgi:lipopolysaccharide export system permease protein
VTLITRYLLSAFSRIFLLSLAAFSGIYLLVDFVENVDDFIARQAAAVDYFTYFFGKLPLILSQVTPMAILFGVFMALGGLSRTNELTALRAGGVSLWRISAPLLGVGLLATGGVLFSNELIVPLTAKEVKAVERTIIKGQPRQLLRRDRVWFREADRIVNIRLALPAEGILQGITIYRLDRDFHLLDRVDADRATYQDGAWHFRDVQVRSFGSTGLESIARERFSEKILPLDKTPADFATPEFRNDDLTFPELRDLVGRLEAEEFDATRYRVDMLARLATPFTSLIMAFLGIPFALRKGRNAGLALGVALSVAIGVVFYLIQAMLLAFGYSGIVPPVVAAWAPNFLFVLTGIWLLLASRD